jgi:hypothetical protein
VAGCAAIAPVTNPAGSEYESQDRHRARGAGDASSSTSEARTGGGARGISSRAGDEPSSAKAALSARTAAIGSPA